MFVLADEGRAAAPSASGEGGGGRGRTNGREVRVAAATTRGLGGTPSMRGAAVTPRAQRASSADRERAAVAAWRRRDRSDRAWPAAGGGDGSPRAGRSRGHARLALGIGVIAVSGAGHAWRDAARRCAGGGRASPFPDLHVSLCRPPEQLRRREGPAKAMRICAAAASRPSRSSGGCVFEQPPSNRR